MATELFTSITYSDWSATEPQPFAPKYLGTLRNCQLSYGITLGCAAVDRDWCCKMQLVMIQAPAKELKWQVNAMHY